MNCGQNTLSTTPTPPPVLLLTPPQSIHNFGDSITCGYYALPADGVGNVYSNEGYAGLLDQALAIPSINACRAGDYAADMNWRDVYAGTYAPALGAAQLSTVLIGTNDANICGGSAGCITNWQQALQSSLLWLALPASDKTLGASITQRTGTWTQDPDLPQAINTADPTATLTFSVQQAIANRPLWVAYRVANAGSALGAMSVQVDGVLTGTLNGTILSGVTLATANGTSDAVYVATLPLAAIGSHTVTMAMTSGLGTSFSVVWAGASTGNYASLVGAPAVLIGSLPITGNAALNQVAAQYNAQLSAMVQTLANDGLGIEELPVAGALNPATDLSPDGIHPNTMGHQKLKALFLQAIQ